MANRGQLGGPKVRPLVEKPKKDIVGVVAYIRDKDGLLIKIYWVHSRLRKHKHTTATREISDYWKRQQKDIFKKW